MQFNDATGTPGGPTGWDQWQVNGALAITAGTTASSRFTLSVASLDANNNPGLPAHFDPAQSYQWTILTTTGGISGFNANRFTVDTADFPAPGAFALAQSGGGLVLSYTPVPEPAAAGLIAAAGLGLGGWLRRRRHNWNRSGSGLMCGR